jgi:nitroreductase
LPRQKAEPKLARMTDALDLLEDIVDRRRSVRAFLPKVVDRETIERVLHLASQTPSSCNIQPWSVHIVSGAALQALGEALVSAISAGAASNPEIMLAEPYRDAQRERQIDAAVRLYQAQGIGRHDKAGRHASYLRNYRFFDAPHVAFVFVTGAAGIREVADCGKFIQSFLLGLTAAGIGSCPQGALSEHPAIVRRVLGIDEPGRLLLGISFGYPDESDATAGVRTPRRDTADVATFHDAAPGGPH